MSGSNLNLVIAGDSIGVGSVSGADPWKDLGLSQKYTIENHSYHGAYLGQMAGLNESSVLKDYDPSSGTNWLVVQAGTNDLSQGATASDLYSGIEKLVQDGHAQGFKVAVATVLPRNSSVFAWSSADESARLAYNDSVRANHAGADAIADVAASPIMGSAGAPANAALYLDGLHPTASAVQAYLEPIYASVFSSSASPVQAPQPVVTPAPVTTPAPAASTGSNALVLHVSGDHYQGDPQFQVYVDGKAVGGTQTVTALHSQNQWQDVTLKGDFSPSSAHAVEVRFLNDAYDGSGNFSEGHDRNLYVSSVSLDGTKFGTSEANPAVLLQNGGVIIATTATSGSTGTTAPVSTPAPVSTSAPMNAGTTATPGNPETSGTSIPTTGTTSGTANSPTTAGIIDTTAADILARPAMINAIYHTFLGHGPNEQSFLVSMAELGTGSTLQQLADHLASVGISSTSAGQDNGTFVESLYYSALHRTAEPAGLQAWVAALNGGATQAQVATQIVSSPESQQVISTQNDISLLYQGVLGRTADLGGSISFTNTVLQGHSLLTAAQAMVSSNEFTASHAQLSDNAFVDLLYTQALERHAEASGMHAWTDTLAHGQSRAEIAVAIVGSTEAHTHLQSHLDWLIPSG